jgi:hypothetical protein
MADRGHHTLIFGPPVWLRKAMAPLRHASEHRECLLSGVSRKSRFTVVRTVFDPVADIRPQPPLSTIGCTSVGLPVTFRLT